MIDDLTEDNFIMYAMKAYNSPHYVMSEFEGDLKRTKYLKRLFRRYKITKSLKERLILNHLIYFTMYLVQNQQHGYYSLELMK